MPTGTGSMTGMGGMAEPHKYVVNVKNGLTRVGEKDPWLTDCLSNSEGYPVRCDYKSKNKGDYSGMFMFSPENMTFILNGVELPENIKNRNRWYTIGGKCSVI